MDIFSPTGPHPNKGCWNCAYSYGSFTNKNLVKRQTKTDEWWFCANPVSKHYDSWMPRDSVPDCFVMYDRRVKRKTFSWLKNTNEAKADVLDALYEQKLYEE